VIDQINSQIVDFNSLFAGFISLFGRLGNFLSEIMNISYLPAPAWSLDGLEAASSRYFPVDQRIQRLQ
jgi:hypothetical protein